jgi:hypothetical protein
VQIVNWILAVAGIIGVAFSLVRGAKKIMRWIKQRAHRRTPEYAREIDARKQIIQRRSDFDLAEARNKGEYPFDTPETRNFRPKRGLF